MVPEQASAAPPPAHGAEAVPTAADFSEAVAGGGDDATASPSGSGDAYEPAERDPFATAADNNPSGSDEPSAFGRIISGTSVAPGPAALPDDFSSEAPGWDAAAGGAAGGEGGESASPAAARPEGDGSSPPPEPFVTEEGAEEAVAGSSVAAADEVGAEPAVCSTPSVQPGPAETRAQLVAAQEEALAADDFVLAQAVDGIRERWR